MAPALKSSEDVLKSGIFELDTTRKSVDALLEETKEQAEKIREEFQESSRNNWMENFRRNNNYKIIDNELCVKGDNVNVNDWLMTGDCVTQVGSWIYYNGRKSAGCTIVKKRY